jgi:hypothetical protein
MMGIQPAVMGATQRAKGSEFEHDRFLKGVNGEHHLSGTHR